MPDKHISNHKMAECLHLVEKSISATHYPNKPQGLYEPIAYAMSAGGKRIRPVLTLLAYGIYKDDLEKALPAALALETYHNHTLLHDDLMDNASVRRGKPTVHVKWDANTAILSGDTMLICAVEEILKTNAPRREEVISLFVRTMKEICEGQQYDVNFERRTDVSEEEYMEMIRLKTSVLLAAAAQSGALLADAPLKDAEEIGLFAQCIGLAFQLQDDLLDVFGDSAVFGKKIGGDIRCGKKTYLLIKALERADEKQRADILNWLSSSDDEAKVAAVTAIYEQLGIRRLTEEKIEQLHHEAICHLECLSVCEEAVQPLHDFAASLMGRKS